MQNVKERVRGFIYENFYLDAAETRFADTDSLVESRIIDSTGYMELITYLEETFSVTVADDEMVPENLGSLASIETYILLKQACGVSHA